MPLAWKVKRAIAYRQEVGPLVGAGSVVAPRVEREAECSVSGVTATTLTL